MSKAGKRDRDDRATEQPDTTADDAPKGEPNTPGTPATAGSDGNPTSEAVDAQGSGGSPESGVTGGGAPAGPVSDLDEVPAEVEATDPAPISAGTHVTPSNNSADGAVLEPAALLGKAAEPQAASAMLSSTTIATAPRVLSFQELIQSFVFDVIGVAVTFVSGPPVVPPGSKVTVRTSTLEITEGRAVPAHWYYPDTDEPPQRIILLQHGFLGVGAMYSRTAANLAESTNSIVVVPTYSSNRFVRDGFWLGDDQVHRATAELFLGDRDALTASAVAAGYTQKYGAGALLPATFALIGHSLGGGVAAGAAGYYAEAITSSGGDNHLAGVVLLDGAPQQNVLLDALDKLDGLGTYVPVLELGAPKEFRRVDAALIEHRPGKFNGVVLNDGKHLDAMMGGTPFIQFVSHLYQGFPTPQNQLAAQTIIAGWANDIFAGRIDASTGKCESDCAGIYGELGQAIDIATPDGPTSAVVIGSVPAPVPGFEPMSVTALVAATPPAGKRLLLRV